MLVLGRGDSGGAIGARIGVVLVSFDVSVGGQSMPRQTSLSLPLLDIGR